MEMDFIPVDYDYFDYEGKNYVKIYGRNKEGGKICVIDSCSIYFWIILKKGITEKLTKELIKEIEIIELDVKGRKTKVEKVEKHEKNFLGKKVKALKIFATNHKDLQDVVNKIDSSLIEKRRGYDLNYITKYIIEKKLYPLTWYQIEGEILHDSLEFGGVDKVLDVDFVIKLNSKNIKKKQKDFEPKVLAYDLETDSLKPENGEILMFSLVGKDYKKVISWKKAKTENKNVEFVENEKELLKKFVKLVKEYSPDFLVGYHSDVFDLPFLKERAKKNKIKLPIGLDNTDPKISRGKTLAGRISGITHIDLLKFIKTAYAQYMQSETLSLNEVSKEFLKDSKKDFKIEHSSKIKKENWENYYEYNLHDSVLTLKLFEKFWPDLLEFTKVIKEPTFNISRNGLSKQIESYILHNLEKYNEIPEKRPTNNEIGFRQNSGGVEGAFVYEPKPGIYEDLVMFDFTSMHTSIIISHNISKGTLTTNKKNSYCSPEIEEDGIKRKYYFEKKPGFFPLLLKEIFEKRKKFKEEYSKNPNSITKARSNAFKVLSASAHGYIGFYGARYYSLESSSAILAFVREFNKNTMKKIENQGHEIIMGDTDSVAFTRNNKSKKEIKKLLDNLNADLPGVMHLEIEDFFKRGIWVTTRSGKTGAKKKYALISEEGIIKIRGFETVRRDWCQLARKTQDKILRLILKEGNEKKALEYVKEIINKIKTREIKKEELIIKSQLKKPIAEYKAISPHVVAARKMKERGIPINVGSLIEFYIAEDNGKSKLVRDKTKLLDEKGKYNIKYYLEKQIIPSVENIFQVFNVNIKEITEGKKQEKLGKWF
jgi:DNA polymerase Pol2